MTDIDNVLQALAKQLDAGERPESFGMIARVEYRTADNGTEYAFVPFNLLDGWFAAVDNDLMTCTLDGFVRILK